MEATSLGMNRTVTKMAPRRTRDTSQSANEYTPQTPVDTTSLDAARLAFLQESETLGSIPPPASLKGMAKAGLDKLKGGAPGVLMDKLGERLAFERGGTRLYDALLVKYRAVQQMEPDILPPVRELASKLPAQADILVTAANDTPLEILARIRNDELHHVHILSAFMEKMGGDPAAVTPCADVIGTASMGLVQVVTEPRTTLAQDFTAILSAELTDNAGWELLIELAEQAQESEAVQQFGEALAREREHAAVIKAWLSHVLSHGAGTVAV